VAFKNAQKSRVYLAHLGLSSYARNASAAAPTDMLDVSVLTDTSRQFIAGLNTSTFSADGPLEVDPASNALHDTVSDFKNSSTPTAITYMPLGTDAGSAWLFEAVPSGLDFQSPVGATTDWSLSAQTTGITDINGVILENNTTVTQDTDGSATDNSAASTQGAVFHLHVTAFSGLTSDAIIVEQSATGSFGGEETTVCTFATATGLTSERVVVTGTVARYLRVVDDVTGTGSITRLVAVSRR
jgi:hypothetical protein